MVACGTEYLPLPQMRDPLQNQFSRAASVNLLCGFETIRSCIQNSLFGKKSGSLPLVLVGIGYSSHVVSKAFNAGKEYQVVAFIDDEPWNHRTLINGGIVKYPVELTAMIERKKAAAVIFFEEEKHYFDDAGFRALVELGVPLIHVSEQLKPHAKTAYIRSQLEQCLATEGKRISP